MALQGMNHPAIEQEIGERLRATRLQMNWSQQELADRAGLSLGTIKGLEHGKGTIDSLLRVLRALRRLDALDAFLPDPGISPMQVLRMRGRVRQRAAKRIVDPRETGKLMVRDKKPKGE